MTSPSSFVASFCAVAFLFGARAEEPAWPPPQLPRIPARVFPITAFGALGDGKTMNTDAFRAAIQACSAAGGGRVVVPAGAFLTGPFELASHMALMLEKGALIQASDKFSDFGLSDPLPATQPEIDSLKKKIQPLISGSKLEDVAILGAGTIDGAGAVWWAKSDKASERATPPPAPAPSANPGESPLPPARPLYVPRPHLVVLRDCARVHVQGVTLRNSPMFHLVPARCRDVLIEDVTIHSPADSPNTDGIDPANCRDVVIRRCTIDTGDDNIALKAGSGGGFPTENVMVSDCHFLRGHGVSIGSEVQTGVRHFLVQRCAFENTGTALRIKSDRTRGGVVEDVTYRDITMKNVEAAITVFLFYDNKKTSLAPELKPVTDDTPIIRDLHFLNIACDGATRKAGEIIGLPESPVNDVTLENVRITGAASGFTQQDVKNLRLINVDVQTPPATVSAEAKAKVAPSSPTPSTP
jgi:polygalacturonase